MLKSSKHNGDVSGRDYIPRQEGHRVCYDDRSHSSQRTASVDSEKEYCRPEAYLNALDPDFHDRYAGADGENPYPERHCHHDNQFVQGQRVRRTWTDIRHFLCRRSTDGSYNPLYVPISHWEPVVAKRF